MKMKHSLSVVFGLALLLGAALPVHAGTFYFGGGAFAMNPLKVANTPQGTISTLGQVYLPLTFGYRTDSLMTTLRFTPLGPKDSDGSVSRRVIDLSFPFFLDSGGNFKVGPGILAYWLSGTGGTVELNNGTSTSTFYRPNTSSFSTLITLNAGVGVDIAFFRWDLDFVITSILSSRRAVNLSTALTFPIF
jgi:hypothetical protein